MRTVLRTVALLALSLSAIAGAQVSAATKVAIQEAAAFTDGFVIDCPAEIEPSIYAVCVATGDTLWSASDLRRWSTYGLERWTTYQAWTFRSNTYLTFLVNPARTELLGIMVAADGSYIIYHATRLTD